MRESDEYQFSALNNSRPRHMRRGRLGDLTESKKEERGEYAQQPGIAPSEMPTLVMPDVPKITSGVMPSYDVLPSNAGRFNFGQLSSFSTTSGTAIGRVVFTQQVPAGRVVIARKFRVNIEGFNGGFSIPPLPFTVTLYVNGQADIYNQVIFVQPLDDWYDCQLIAGPFDIITMTLDVVYGDFLPVGATVQAIAHLSGDMLLPNELPVQYTALRQTAFPVFDETKG